MSRAARGLLDAAASAFNLHAVVHLHSEHVMTRPRKSDGSMIAAPILDNRDQPLSPRKAAPLAMRWHASLKLGSTWVHSKANPCLARGLTSSAATLNPHSSSTCRRKRKE